MSNLNFNEWVVSQLGDRDETQQPLKTGVMWASCAWYARQQEVDKLQRLVNFEREQATEYYTDSMYAFSERDELQKRIDEALGVIEDNHLDTIDMLLLINKILKGEQNDN